MKQITLLFAALLAATACNHDITGLGAPSDPATETFAASLGVDIASMTKTTGGVYYKDVVVGPSTGAEVTAATTSVVVTYAGYLKDGKLFDSSVGATLVPANLIPGFRTGLLGMHEGGKRKIVVPSEQGYGGHSIRDTNNSIKIPRQSTLIFDVEVTKVNNPTTTS